MKDIFFKIALNTLMKNKRRAIATIVGIAISVGLITGALLIWKIFADFYEKPIEEIYGSWAVAQYKTDAQTDGEGERIYILDEKSYGEKSDVRVHIIALEEKNLKMIRGDILEGRFPKDRKEVAISRKFMDHLGKKYSIGDILNLNIKGKNIEYKITGIIKEPHVMDINKGDGYALVNISEDVLHGKAFDMYSLEQYRANFSKFEKNKENLLLYNGELIESKNRIEAYNTAELRGFIIIVLTLISIGSFILIYNTFDIMLRERKKTYGILETVGATDRQNRRIFMYESWIFSVIAIPIGLIVGSVGTKIILNLIGDELIVFLLPHYDRIADVQLPYEVNIISAILTFAIIQFASVLPLYIEPSDYMARNSKNVIIEKLGKRKGRFIDKISKRLFWFNLSYRNAMGYRKHFRPTVAFITMTIMLFTVGSSLINYSDSSIAEVMKKAEKYNLAYQTYSLKDKGNIEEIYKKFSERVNIERGGYTTSAAFSPYVYGQRVEYMAHIMDRASYTKYLKKLGFSDDEIEKSKGKVVSLNYLIEYDKKNNEFVEKDAYPSRMKPDKINVKKEGGADTEIGIVKYTSILPEGLFSMSGTPVIIASEEDSDKIISYEGKDIIHEEIILKVKEPQEAYLQLRKVCNELGLDTDGLENLEQYKNDIRSVTMVTKLFLYGFIFLMGIMATATAFNAMYSNVQLRKLEFINLLSIGMEDKSIFKMIVVENLILFLRALVYGFVVSIMLMLLMDRQTDIGETIGNTISYKSLLMGSGLAFITIGIITVHIIFRLKKRVLDRVTYELNEINI